MLLHKINTGNFTFTDLSIKTYWETFKSDIISIDKKQWNQEDLNGSSEYQWKSMTYYYFMYLLVLITNEMKDNNKTWDYYVTKYNLVNIKKCLTCLGINFNKGLQAFGLPTGELSEGIEDIGIETSFEVEPTGLNANQPNQVVLLELLNNPNYCVNYITNNCD